MILTDLSSDDLDGTGLDLFPIENNDAFALRRRHGVDSKAQMLAMQRLTRAFVETPETILQELANTALELCGADSACISMRDDERTDETKYYHWLATAGQYAPFAGSDLPQHPSACGLCLQRGTPQAFTMAEEYLRTVGVDAPVVTDGVIVPWQVGDTRGTIFVMAHGRVAAFDSVDLVTMQMLADFVAMSVRQERLQLRLITQTGFDGAAGMAHALAHQINNPLQSLTNVMYLASVGDEGRDAKTLAADMEPNLTRLSALVKVLLEVPLPKSN